MRVANFFICWLLLAGSVDRAGELRTLRERAERILEQNQSLEITTSEARRQVQVLLRDMRGWAEEHDVTLREESRTIRSPTTRERKPLTADECPFFFEEELNELCPLDLEHSEVWGAEVLHCRYVCE